MLIYGWLGVWLKQGVYRTVAVMLSVMLLQVLPVGQPSVGASTISLPLDVVASAELVVDATVVSEFVVEAGALPQTVAILAVDSHLKGASGATIPVVTVGGLTLDGRDVSVSHAPRFSVGEHVQVALVRSPQLSLSAALQQRQSISTPLFAVHGGERGIEVTTNWFEARSAGLRDFVTTAGPQWSSFSPPATYLVNPAGSGLSEEAVIAAVQRAAQAWEDVPGSVIDFEYAGTTTKGLDPGDEHNVISFGHIAADNELARTAWFPNADGTFEFDIVLSSEHRWSDGAVPLRYDVQSTVTHELGHALGLGHPSGSSASQEIMFKVAPRGEVKGLGNGDRAGVRLLYPSLIPAPSCDDVTVTVDLNTGVGAPTEGDDVILGTPGPDWIWALGGDDIVCGGGGIDRIFAGDGQDQVFGEGGSDRIWGEGGNDTVYGGSGADRIWGGDGDDVIFGQGGQDALFGDAGNDEMQGNWQSDELSGGPGNDELRGAGGRDTLHGDGGNDSLFGGLNTDYLNGGSGNDLGDGQRGRDNPLLPGVSGCEELEATLSC